MAIQGHIEQVREEGLISGWCWDAAAPERHVTLTVLVDGEPVGATTADVFREDLAAAGIGDGSHAFSYLLPWTVVSGKSLSHIRLADEASNQLVGDSVAFSRTAVLPVEDRLTDLESHVRRLTAQLETVRRRAEQDTAMISGVLATIGAFFTRLAEAPLEAASHAVVPSLAGLLETTRATLEPFSMAIAAAPILTICVEASGPLDRLHACLRAIHLSGADSEAEVVVIDDSRSDAAALLPALVQNLRYWRLQPGQSMIDARNIVALTADRRFAAFLSGAVTVGPDWLSEVLATFERLPLCAVIGAKVVRPDATIEASGLCPDRLGLLSDFGYAEHELNPRCNRLVPVAAVPDMAVVVRGSAFARLGGLDAAFRDPHSATIEFCIRCWDAGLSVHYQPNCRVTSVDQPGMSAQPAATTDADLATLLVNRWNASPRQAWPKQAGRALVMDGPASPPDLASAVLGSATALQSFGYDVAFCVPGQLEQDPALGPALRGIGIEVLRAPFQASAAAVVGDARPAFDVIYMTVPATLALAPESLRALSPRARIVLLLHAAAEEILADRTINPAGSKRLLAAVDASDCVVVPTAAGARGLRQTGRDAKLWDHRPSQAPGYDERTGIWLLAEPGAAASNDARRWFGKSVLPKILKALPDVRINTISMPGAEAGPHVTQHDAKTVTRDLLMTMRLAIAPLRAPAAQTAAVEACLAATLPVVATEAALDGDPPPAGIVVVEKDARLLARRVIQLYTDGAAWQALADAIQPAPPADRPDGGDRWALICRTILMRLSLPLR
jgi:O-antigen biosynthesis protein